MTLFAYSTNLITANNLNQLRLARYTCFLSFLYSMSYCVAEVAVFLVSKNQGSADFPQYLIAQPDEHDPQSGTLAPMSEESAPTIKAKEHNLRNTNWKEIGLRLLKALWNFLLRWLEKQ